MSGGARRRLAEGCAALVAAIALSFLAFQPGSRGEFVSDDVNAIVENEWVTGPIDPVGIFTHFSWWGSGRSESPGYRPAATLMFAATRVAGGAEPYPFHLLNMVLHALCSFLVFALARRLGLALEGAAVAASVFVLLPIHSEAVVWAVGGAELGAALGFLCACWAIAWYRDSAAPVALAVATASIAIGAMFKENALTALAAPVVLAIASLPDRSRMRRDLTALAALAGGVAVYAAVRSQALGPTIASVSTSELDNPLAVLDPAGRLLGAVAVLGRYLAITAWPAPLSVDYSYDALGIGPGFLANADSLIAIAAVAAAIVAVLRVADRRFVLVCGLLLSAAAYSIVSNTFFVLGTILGERLFYVPSSGLAIACGALLEPVLRGRSYRIHAWVGLGIVACAWIAVDRSRAAEWRTPVTLFESAARAYPGSARAHMELASAYGRAGRIEDAERHFARAMEIKPDYASASYNHANTLARAGRFAEAATIYQRTLELDPKLARAWHNLALTQKILGRRQEYVASLAREVELDPGAVTARLELAENLLALDRNREAIEHYDALVAYGAAGAAVYFNRGVAKHRLGGCADALPDYREAASHDGAPAAAAQAAEACERLLGTTR